VRGIGVDVGVGVGVGVTIGAGVAAIAVGEFPPAELEFDELQPVKVRVKRKAKIINAEVKIKITP
jgi:hypothetical protein